MSNFEARLKNLNKQQKKAVGTIEGPVMVVAGPGSGKTELLSLRVVNILKTVDVAPSNILCLTFTDAAAFNMRQRLIGLLGRDAYRVAIYTFHSFGVEIINRYPESFYNGASLLPADEVTQIQILEKIFSSLEYGNSLRAEYNNQFVYLFKAKSAIEYLKKAGLTPTEFKTIIAENKKAVAFANPIIQAVFNERISKKIFPVVHEALKKLGTYKSKPLPGLFKPFAEALVEFLREAVNQSEENDTTEHLTAWKNDWTSKGNDGLRHLSDLLDIEKIEALADIYKQYIEAMHDDGYYDYNDMILDTIAMLEKNQGIKLDLQEKYQYLLVDEFQDTNNAQMRLLRLLSDNPVHEGRPNIMIVGDDDQAIYKFQGAEISNILDFQKYYRDPVLIVLKENYRSNQNILNAARYIIQKGMGRLERIIPELKKELVAANKELKAGAIYNKIFPSRSIEYQWIAKEVQKLIDKGISLKEIAIIAREHKDLETLVPYFHAAQLPISYERQENVLQEPLILQLIKMARFVDSIMKKNEDADDLLPEILNYPFWGIERSIIWELSIKARGEHKPWLMVMRESGGRLKEIADFFIELGGQATHKTAEEILHELIGGPQHILPDENDDDAVVRHDMFSPFRSYYFGKKRFTENRAEYLRFLSSLQSFIGSLREYRRGKRVMTEDIIDFFDVHTKNNLAINNFSPFINAEDAVQFMSAHRAKGLEFEAVFVINCQEDIWSGRGRGRGNIPIPMNLPISPAGDNLDDQLRLFYVAMTRAKRLLYFTSYQNNERGKEAAMLGFLASADGTSEIFKPEFMKVKDIMDTPEGLLSNQWDIQYVAPFSPDEKALLKPMLEKYQLSVTHLQNFLNVADAGPLVFFEKNLIMFPEPKIPSGAFGSAMHKAIHHIYKYLKSQSKLPTIKQVQDWFEEFLSDERMNQKNFDLFLKRGQKGVEVFYKKMKDDFLVTDKSEYSFKNQGVVVNDVPLSGVIDRINILEREAIVWDFKTGKAIKSWEPIDPYEKIKAWKYRRQLIFYKLLIENSRDFEGKYFVNKGGVEFVEPVGGEIIDLSLDMGKEEVQRVESLITAVYGKIKTLNFPDINKYSKDLKGIIAFEDDLLGGL